MNTEETLPTGVTLNANHEDLLSIELEYEIVNSTVCQKCDCIFESILFTSGNRHEGAIRINNNTNYSWKNSLPKDRTRCLKILDENLQKKLDIHNKGHNND